MFNFVAREVRNNPKFSIKAALIVVGQCPSIDAESIELIKMVQCYRPYLSLEI